MTTKRTPKPATPADPAAIRQALVQLYRDAAGHIEGLPDRFFTGEMDPVSRQGVIVLKEAAGPVSSIALGLSFGTGSSYMSVVPQTGQAMIRDGLGLLARLPMLNHLHECPGHPTEGHHDDDEHAHGPDAVDAGGSASGEPDRALGEGRG